MKINETIIASGNEIAETIASRAGHRTSASSIRHAIADTMESRGTAVYDLIIESSQQLADAIETRGTAVHQHILAFRQRDRLDDREPRHGHPRAHRRLGQPLRRRDRQPRRQRAPADRRPRAPSSPTRSRAAPASVHERIVASGYRLRRETREPAGAVHQQILASGNRARRRDREPRRRRAPAHHFVWQRVDLRDRRASWARHASRSCHRATAWPTRSRTAPPPSTSGSSPRAPS